MTDAKIEQMLSKLCDAEPPDDWSEDVMREIDRRARRARVTRRLIWCAVSVLAVATCFLFGFYGMPLLWRWFS